ncbi:uncharacterized protein [Palaemon carinicauda]|uniref:uncharacterized protein n=1 Tax=Palaemon carinicauda TaxID=392227 RepID=UPI0035B58DEA
MTVVRLSVMYGAETWAIKNTEEKKLNVAEMKRLRWICGVTRRDKIRNEVIIGTKGVEKLSDKIQESRLRRYGRVIKRDEPFIGRRVMEIEVKGTRRGGRPKRSGIDLRSKGLIGDEVLDRGLGHQQFSNPIKQSKQNQLQARSSTVNPLSQSNSPKELATPRRNHGLPK